MRSQENEGKMCCKTTINKCPRDRQGGERERGREGERERGREGERERGREGERTYSDGLKMKSSKQEWTAKRTTAKCHSSKMTG